MTMIYGGAKGWQPTSTTPLRDPDGTVTDYGSRLGYKSDAPLIYTGGAMGGENQNFLSPQASKTGQPVPASFEFMGTADKERFTNQGGRVPNERISGPVGPTPVGYQPYGDRVLPVYDQLNPQTYDNLGEITGYDYVPYNVGGTPALVRVPQYSFPAPVGNDVAKQQSAAFLMAMLNGTNTGNMSPGSLGFQGMPAADNRSAILAKLYELDPQAWAQAVSAGAANPQGPGNGQGQWGGPRQDRNIENEAMRRRQYDIQGRNYARAGLPSPTILDIPRVEGWTGEGEAPYQRYGRQVQNGYALPFDYEVGSPWYNRDNSGMGGGQWGGRGPRGPRNPGGGQTPGQNPTPSDGNQLPQYNGGWNEGQSNWGGDGMNQPQGTAPWFNQLPWWARAARNFGPPLGSGMTQGA